MGTSSSPRPHPLPPLPLPPRSPILSLSPPSPSLRLSRVRLWPTRLLSKKIWSFFRPRNKTLTHYFACNPAPCLSCSPVSSLRSATTTSAPFSGSCVLLIKSSTSSDNDPTLPIINHPIPVHQMYKGTRASSTLALHLRCAYHPKHSITNFCLCEECLLPVCPTCVKVHTE